LNPFGWETVPDKSNENRCIAVPTDLSKFLSIPPADFKGSLPLEQLALDLPREEEFKDPITNDIFVSIGNLRLYIIDFFWIDF
jgi:hypothetical protein